jgi:UDP-N-acetylmuramate--alanine ligase
LDLLSYRGVKRRFELVGTKKGVTVIDDYAHHPTAVKETIEAAKTRYPGQKIWAIFEPHTFSRTKATLGELVKAFDSADDVLISEIYPARERIQDATITSNQVIEAIKDHNSKFQIHNSVRLVKNKEDALEILKNETKPSDVLLIMAVGSFNRLAYELKEKL